MYLPDLLLIPKDDLTDDKYSNVIFFLDDLTSFFIKSSILLFLTNLLSLNEPFSFFFFFSISSFKVEKFLKVRTKISHALTSYF